MKCHQGKFYDHKYSDRLYADIGLPDLKIVDHQNIKNQKILSVGGGMGADLWYLAKTNDITVLDSSRSACKIAKKHGLKSKVADVQKTLPYPKATFDIVVLKDILEHVLDPFTLLVEASRVLKNRGYIVISIPNHFYIWFRLRILFGHNLLWKTWQHDHSKDQQEWNYMHVRFFTWTGLQQMIKLARLRITKTYWDLGALAHYSDPVMFYLAVKDKPVKSTQAKLLINLIYPVYKTIDLFFPRSLRAKFVALNPALLCAGFYLHLKKV